MRRVSGAALLRIWEDGQGRHPLDQALAILAEAFPEVEVNILATLSIGQRDAYLLEVYKSTFGGRLNALVDCPQCRETLELPLRVDDIRVAPEAEATGEADHLHADGYAVRFRLPNSIDLATVVHQADGLADLAAGRAALLQRCVLEATHAGHAVAVTDLPDPVIAALGARLEACDPQAEVQLHLTCPACDHHWRALCDIVTFFWAKVHAQAKALLRDVHTLAQAYGWHEADILAMSEVRRQCYLEMLT